MTTHYRMTEGISGYAEGDLLIETTTGDTARVVRDGRGLCLVPTVADLPYDEAHDVTRISLRLAPIDVGFDVRAQRMKIGGIGTAATLRASYATRKGDRRVISGPRAEVVRRLRAHGYRFTAAE